MARVLVIGESKQETQELAKIFQSVKVPVEVASSFDVALERIAQDPPALIVAQKPERLETLQSLRAVLQTNAPATPYLVTIPEPKLEMAMEVMQRGAYDCVAKPYSSLEILMASKRASLKAGRMLFVKKLEPSQRPTLKILAGLILIGLISFGIYEVRQGPPPESMSLGSANLSGIQWENRTLWVGDWFESTITKYEVAKGILRGARLLQTKNIFKMQDGQPILVCNTPDLMVTIASDLKIRIHQRSVGLPTFQTVPAPGVNPTGLAWDGKNIWSSDGQTNLLYKHGQDLRVIDTVKSIFPQPMGLAWDGTGLWVIGDKPLKIAKLELKSGGYVWEGPVALTQLLPEAVIPTGFTIGFGRLWAVSGGDPKIVSAPMPELVPHASVKKLKTPSSSNVSIEDPVSLKTLDPRLRGDDGRKK
jgi:CheY-like chemotaxis protein